MANESAEELLEQAILNYSRASDDRSAMLTAWIVVGEFIDAEGELRLVAYASQGLPFWRIDGMLNAAADAIEYTLEEEEEHE